MLREDVAELHYITSIPNLTSIARGGILSHDLANSIPHESVASADVQERRRLKAVPNGSRLHTYANLYFHARNPMLSRLLYDGREDLIILRVSEAVLDIPGAVLTDGNAASDPTRFLPSPKGLENLDKDLIFATYWTDPDPLIKLEKKRVRNAEVLIPNSVHPGFITGFYVQSQSDQERCCAIMGQDGRLTVAVNRRIFFG